MRNRVSTVPAEPGRGPEGVVALGNVERNPRRRDRTGLYSIGSGFGVGAITVIAALLAEWIEPASVGDVLLLVVVFLAANLLALTVVCLALLRRLATAHLESEQRIALSRRGLSVSWDTRPSDERRATSATPVDELLARVHARKVSHGLRLSAEEIVAYRDADRR